MSVGNQSFLNSLTITRLGDFMETAQQEDIIQSIGGFMSNLTDCDVEQKTKWGRFKCRIENFNHFSVLRRDFETTDVSVDIPFSSFDTSIQMLFSLDAPSCFNDRKNLLWMDSESHSLNLFGEYDCKNILNAKGKQNDISFRLDKSFYNDLMLRVISSSEAKLPSMILEQKQFNTINDHVPSDSGIAGLLTNIIECPFTGSMREAFIREHVNALLMLQLFHFSRVVTGNEIDLQTKITRADRGVLNEIKRYIDQQFLEPASLHELTMRFGINEFKLKHGFKALFDTSPIRYLQLKRLEFSRTLLNDTNLTLQQIADRIGYQHAANYTTAFKRTFGKSPSLYRRVVKN